MEPKLGGLRDRLEEFLQDRAGLERSYASGASNSLPLPRLFHTFADLTRPETFQEVREALEGQATGTESHRRLRRLCGALAELAVEARSAEADAALAHWEVTAQPSPEESGLVLADAVRRIAREANRGRRSQLARAVTREVESQERQYARRVEAVHHVAARLELKDPLAVYQQFTPTDLLKLEQDARAFLSLTEDGYRDLLGYAIRRTEPALRFTQAERHDLERAVSAPWAFANTGMAELAHASRRWIEEWGIADGAGKLEVNGDDLPGKPVRSRVVATRIPDRIAGYARLEVGIPDALTLLRLQGAGLSLALRDRRLPLEDRRLEGGFTPALFAGLFGRMPTDPRWLERFLRLPRSGARELARLFAFAEVATMREGCARLSYELQLLRRGAESELRDVYEELFRNALRVGIPRGEYLFELSPHLAVAARLQGRAVAGALLPILRERFDEDHWRNPNAAGFLREVAARAGAPETFATLAPTALEGSLAGTAKELLAVMGA